MLPAFVCDDVADSCPMDFVNLGEVIKHLLLVLEGLCVGRIIRECTHLTHLNLREFSVCAVLSNCTMMSRKECTRLDGRLASVRSAVLSVVRGRSNGCLHWRGQNAVKRSGDDDAIRASTCLDEDQAIFDIDLRIVFRFDVEDLNGLEIERAHGLDVVCG